MPFFNDNSSKVSCTTFVHRPGGQVSGAREVFDEASRIAVTAFPTSMIKDMVASRAAVAACYLLAGSRRGYIGETGNIGRRLSDHYADPSKSFADEVFVITGGGNAAFDKTAAVYLQHRLTCAAEEAGLIEILKGTSARILDLPAWRRAPLDRIVDDTMRLLYDAGCRFFDGHVHQPLTADAARLDKTEESEETASEADDGSPMEIGIVATPAGTPEFSLSYGDLWARGYDHSGGFVVTAGSEVRSLVNPSVNPILHKRRAELTGASALAEIPGVTDRKRLITAVWFPSRAIAAKVVSGAHVSGHKWAAVDERRPLVLAA